MVAESRLDCLKAMGIEVWTPRRTLLNEQSPEPLSQAPLAADERDLGMGQPDWPALQEQVKQCSRCSLHETRTQTVFGVGDPEAAWMFVGEAPGEQEDLKGEPFVGRAGQLLDEMIRALDLTREKVYIANVLKCRPPRNRDPSPEESRACEPFLLRQAAWVKPSIIIAVGRIAAQNLLKTQTPIGKLRGMVHDYQGTPLVVTYHPAYLLRAQTEKRRAWEDLKLARRTVDSLR